MYINKNKLSHLLKPDHYRSEEFFQTELSHLFDVSWIPVGVTDEIPQPGDFFTTEFAGRPLLIKNYDGEYTAFLNICGHRHCRITNEEKGNCPTIRCQYHGWEYKSNGYTGKIPDAQCFRPFDRENTRIRKYRTEVCGKLIFVCFSDSAPSFDHFIGSLRGTIEDWFGGQTFHFGERMTYQLESNRKISVENTLESYHIPFVHEKTIRIRPEEKVQDHDIGQHYSSLYTVEPDTITLKIQDGMMRLLGGSPTHRYAHHLIYPNIMMIGLDMMTMIQVYVPTSATTHRWDGFIFPRTGSAAWNRPLHVITDPLVTLGARSVVEEDTPLIHEVQAGMNHSPYPGVLGTIEERLFAFQEYILEKCEGRERESDAWQEDAKHTRPPVAK